MSTMESGDNSIFPDDLVINHILTRLPVKSLLCCKLVCKLWCSTIQDPDFAELHYTHSLSRPQGTQFLISFYCKHYFYKENRLEHTVMVDLEGKTANLSGLPLLDLHSCLNGLIVYTSNDGCVHVSNPTTKEMLTLPHLTTQLNDFYDSDDPDTGYYDLDQFFEIGYDRVSQRHKVLNLCLLNIGINNIKEYYTECSIITLGSMNMTPCWRKLGELPSHVLSLCHKTYTNGALHWRNRYPSGVADGSPKDQVIVAFDFSDEKFRVIPFPDCIISSTMTLLDSMLGQLVLTDSEKWQENNIVDLWILEDYAKQVWSRKTFKLVLNIKNEFCRPRGVIPTTGEIILKPTQARDMFWLYYYDSTKNTSRKVEFTRLPSQEFCKGARSGQSVTMNHFVESLYSWKI